MTETKETVAEKQPKSTFEELIVRYAIPILWVGPAVLFVMGMLATPANTDRSLRTQPVAIEASLSARELKLTAKRPPGAQSMTVQASTSNGGVKVQASADKDDGSSLPIDPVILFMTIALTVAAIGLRFAQEMMPSLTAWIKTRWLSESESAAVDEELHAKYRFAAYAFGFVVLAAFVAYSAQYSDKTVNARFIAAWVVCPFFWCIPLVAGFWSLVKMAYRVRRALVDRPAEPKLVVSHPDGCGGSSVIGRTVIAISSPLLVATVALATVAFFTADKTAHHIVRFAAAAVMIVIVLPALWLVLVEPLLAAQRSLANAISTRLNEDHSTVAKLDERYDAAVEASQWSTAKEITDAGAPVRARRDALASLRTLPISTALLAQVTVSQVASVVVILARIVTPG